MVILSRFLVSRLIASYIHQRARFITNTIGYRSTYTMAARERMRVNDVIKGAEDKRVYRGLELNNGLKVLLVSDEKTDKSAAAIDVHIGHMKDPKELPGLAHFCEHMLFLGTEKYPSENEYHKYISEHGGSSNAYTSSEHTNYYFDVSPEHLRGAVDRFSQFFIAPLFNASATEREVNAVNSENDKNLQSDTWRLYQLEKATSKRGHDYSKFGTGNKVTLETKPKEMGLDPRDELLKFHTQWYSSNIMSLSILGRESLDELTEMVHTMFGECENKDLTVPEWSDHPFGPDQLKLKAYVVPVKDLRGLHVTFPIPDLHEHYKAKPGSYLGHMIGHEGPGSLLSELKAKGWVNTLVGGEESGARGFMFFIVNVDLTEEGIEHTDEIVTHIFEYLNMLRAAGPLEWVFRECQSLNAMTFRFKDKEKPQGFVTNVASNLHRYRLNEVLSGPYLLEEYKPDLIEQVLSHLIPENIRIAVVGQKFEGHTDKKEEWYGTDYKIEEISDELIQMWKNAGANENLRMPDANEFIPTNFDLLTRDEEANALPCLMQNGPMSRVWYKQDNEYLLPKACIAVEFTSPLAYLDPTHASMVYMFVSLFRDTLNEYAYAAELAGLVYSLDNSKYGLTLAVEGYSDKQHVLLRKVMEKMTSFQIDPKRFDILKENYLRGLKNFRAEQPHQHATYYTSILMAEHAWTKDELLNNMEEVTLERVQQFIPQLLSKMHIEFLLFGNITKQKASEIVAIVEETLQSTVRTKPLLPSQLVKDREYQIPDNSSYLFREYNEVHSGSALELYYQCSLQSIPMNVVLELFCQIISEPCFNVLRTQEQLGYIVFSGVRRAHGTQGLRIIVQSDKSCDFVDQRAEAFLQSLDTYLDNMSDEEFQRHLSALVARRLEKPKKLSHQSAKYWGEIVSRQYNFDRDSIEVAHLKTLTKEDVVTFYRDMIAEGGPHRSKMAVHIVSSAKGEQASVQSTLDGLEIADDRVKQPTTIHNVTSFKSGLGLFPLVKPYICIGSGKSKL
ncbi:PREDICTED: insulin-degrading enzyme-like [Priapulus caudatus]|uniref:Insulin-degrading enzyme-like n=1 Tax=Priapulus caudatus TaxID=37621 RepID=A0ABM1F8B6_PRICU|nr:PREDICTED: insulin-degrading enzyme-like [Priapulus caudatus]